LFKDLFEGYRDGACQKSGVNFITEAVKPDQEKVCNRCPVFNECFEYALHNEIWDVWASMGPIKRKKLRKKLGIPEPGILPMKKERKAS